MSCPTPVHRFDRQGNSLGYVPCGKCLQCRIDKRNEWTWRIQAACRDKDAMFVTLTIDDEHLCGGSVKVSSCQRFIKRLRKNVNAVYGVVKDEFGRSYANRPIQYFLVSEYGDPSNTLRPHYHAIIIGLSCGKPLTSDIGDIPLVRKSWPFGFIKCEPACKSNIRYVLKYLDKGEYDDVWEFEHPDLLKPFRLMSKGIGLQWIKDNQELLREGFGSFFFDGAYRPLPRYYKEKLFSRRELLDMRKSFLSDKSKANRIAEYMRDNHCTFDEAVFALGRQNLLSLEKKVAMKAKGI